MTENTPSSVGTNIDAARDNMNKAAVKLNASTRHMYDAAINDALRFDPTDRTDEVFLTELCKIVGRMALATQASDNEFESFCDDTESLVSYAVLVKRLSNHAMNIEHDRNQLRELIALRDNNRAIADKDRLHEDALQMAAEAEVAATA